MFCLQVWHCCLVSPLHMNYKICDVSLEFLFLILTWKGSKVGAKLPHSVLRSEARDFLCRQNTQGFCYFKNVRALLSVSFATYKIID